MQALQLFLCALEPSLFVFPGEADKALPGRPLTCLLITKVHPAEHNADLSCQRLLGEEERGDKNEGVGWRD